MSSAGIITAKLTQWVSPPFHFLRADCLNAGAIQVEQHDHGATNRRFSDNLDS